MAALTYRWHTHALFFYIVPLLFLRDYKSRETFPFSTYISLQTRFVIEWKVLSGLLCSIHIIYLQLLLLLLSNGAYPILYPRKS